MKTKLKRFKPGEVIFETGETSRNMYIIQSGTARVLIEKEGKLIPLTELGKGQYLGEMSFLTGVKRSAMVVAESSLLANEISPDILEDEQLGISTWAVAIAKVLVRRIRATTELLGEYIIGSDDPERLKGRRAEDLKFLEVDTINSRKPGRLYLKGQLTESTIENLKARIRELQLKKVSPLILDFSDVIDIDQAGINYIFGLTQSSQVSDEKLLIENIQLIRDKVLTIKGLQDILNTTRVPLKRVEKDEILITQGDTDHSMYVVKNGVFSIIRKTESGDIDLAAAERGDVIGEMALIKDGARSAEVKAVKPGVVHVIDIQEFYNNVYNVPGWFMELIRGLVQRLRDTNEMLEKLGQEIKEKEGTSEQNIFGDSSFGLELDVSYPGYFRISGYMSLKHLQYLIQIIKLEIKKKPGTIVIDLKAVTTIEPECVPVLLSVYTSLKSRGIILDIKGSQKNILFLFKQYNMD